MFWPRHFFRLLITHWVVVGVAEAHPTAYVGARQWMGGVMGDATMLEMYHTYGSGTAWGMHSMLFDREENDGFAAIQHNWLLKRWNLPDAQANTYLGLGGGAAKREGASTEPAVIGFFRADYETRRIYTAIQAKGITSDAFMRRITSIEAGFAPYLAEFDELNTWLILQVTQMTGMDDEFDLIPKLRFFKNNIFVELGATHRGRPVASLMVHF